MARMCTALLILFVPGFLFSQNYSSVWYNTDNLLKQNSIKDITKDRYGFIWIATESELIRYDGHQFMKQEIQMKSMHLKTFKGSVSEDHIIIPNDAEQERILIRNRKTSVIEKADPNAELRIIHGQKYYLYIKRAFGTPIADVNYFVEVKNGYYGFSNNKIIYTDRKSGKEIQTVLPFNRMDIKNIFTFNEVLFYADIKRKKVLKFENGTMSEIKADPVFTASSANIYWEKINNQTFVICDDTVYLAEYGKNLSIRKIITYPKIGYFQFYSIFFDPDFDVLYLGSLTKGLNIIRPGRFSVATLQEPFANNVFNAGVLVDGKNILTPRGLLAESSGIVKKYPFHVDNNTYTIAKDFHGNILCTREGNLVRYSKNTVFAKEQIIKMPFDANRIFTVNGRFYIAGKKEGSFFMAEYKDDSFQQHASLYRFPGFVASVVPYTKNTLLVGLANGLYKINTVTGKQEKIPIPDISLRKICKGRDGKFWIISENSGFFLFQNEKLVRMPLDDHQFLLFSHDILEDKNGFLWIPTNNGLFKILRNRLVAAAGNSTTEPGYYRYSTADGLANNEFNGGSNPVGNITIDGKFVLPSMEGLVFFDPLTTKSFYPDRKSFFLEKVKIDSQKEISFNHRVELPNSFENAAFMIDIPYYANNENLILEAKGTFSKNSGWKRIPGRTFTLSALAPGEYDLDIRMMLDSKGHYLTKKIQISVPPLYYQTLWFKILLIVAGILLLLLLIRNRTRKLQSIVQNQTHIIRSTEKNLELSEIRLQTESQYQEELFQTITHDIATPIKHLSNLSQMINRTDNTGLQKKYMESVYQSAEQLYILTMSLRDYREIFSIEQPVQEPYFLYEVISYKIVLFKDIADHRNNKIITDVPEAMELTVSKIALSVIIHNILDNAVKNTEEGSITIAAQEEKEAAVISVSDTGKGMDPKKLDHYNQMYEQSAESGRSGYPGLGLYMIIRLCRKFNIKIEFSRNLSGGTTITLSVPHSA